MKQLMLFICTMLVTQFVSALPEIHEWQSKAGATVLFIEAPELEMLDVQVVFDAGAARDGEQFGLATMTNALLLEGTKKRTAQEIAEAFENVGAQVGGGAARDMNWVSLRTLTLEHYLAASIETFNDVLTNPLFAAADVDRVRSQMHTNIVAKQQSPSDLGSDLFMSTMYSGHPYGSPVDGTLDSLPKLTPDALRAFYGKYFTAKNAVVAMIGALSLAEAKTLAEQMLDGLPEGQEIKPLPDVPMLGAGQFEWLDFPSSQSRHE